MLCVAVACWQAGLSGCWCWTGTVQGGRDTIVQARAVDMGWPLMIRLQFQGPADIQDWPGQI